MNDNKELSYLDTAAEAQKAKTQLDYETARDEALRNVNREEAKLLPTFQAGREQVNVASQIGAKNFAERWAQRGQTNAGIAAQAELSQGNVLAREIGNINKQETTAKTGFAENRTDIENKYSSGLASAYADIDLATAEAKRQEAIRLENQKYQRQQDAMANARANYQTYGSASSNNPINGSVRTLNGVTQQFLDGKWQKLSYAKDEAGNIIDKKSVEWNQKGYGNTGQSSAITFKDEKGNTNNYKIWVKDNVPNIIVRGNPIPLVVNKQNGADLANYIIELGRQGTITPQQMVELNNTIEVLD